MLNKNNQDFGAYCYQHSLNCGCVLIDKIVFSFPTDWLFQNPGLVDQPGSLDLLSYGDTNQVHIGGERITHGFPIIFFVRRAFDELLVSNIFRQPIRDFLWLFVHNVDGALEKLVSNGLVFSQLEIAFDFPGMNPIRRLDPNFFHCYNGTVYTNDNHQRVKKNSTADGSLNNERNGKNDSLVCIYDRAKVLGLKDCPLWRLEFRIKQQRKRLLDIGLLNLNMMDAITTMADKLYRIASTVIPQGSLVLAHQNTYVSEMLPRFIPVIWE